MESDYKKSLLSIALSLDNSTSMDGLIYADIASIISNNNDSSIKSLFAHISKILNENPTIENKELIKDLKKQLTLYLGSTRIAKALNNGLVIDNNDESLESLIIELDDLIGLKRIKDEVKNLIAFQHTMLLRKKYGLKVSKNTLHMAFTGNPGTGKTSVARIVGKIYKKLGLLSKGHFIEVSRTDLIAGYQGQTALKVKSVIDNAKGGVLFIDEAYSITENDKTDSYGRECLTELTKALEDYRDDLVVIVAGYSEPMKKFFDSNPGLKSRFNTFIEFDDYSVDELMQILQKMCLENDYKLCEDTFDIIKKHIANECSKAENFSNGRYVRNIYDKLIMQQAKRIDTLKNINKQTLSELKAEDFVQ